MVSKFHNGIRDPKGQENKIYTVVKAVRRSIAATQSLSPAVLEPNTSLKRFFFGSKNYTKEPKEQRTQIFWNNLASFEHLGIISDLPMVSRCHNGIYDAKGQEVDIYTIVKGSGIFYRRHTVSLTSYSKVKHVLKKCILWNTLSFR